jgi:hypothetical protein
VSRSRKIYLASSWRNAEQPALVAALRAAGHEVYDFRNPRTGGPPDRYGGLLDHGFAWSDIDPDWQGWDGERYRDLVTQHPLAEAGYEQDMAGLEWCDTCVLLLPCGRSAHLEAGWAAGAGKAVVGVLRGELEPELMYRMFHAICLDEAELLRVLGDVSEAAA